MVGDFGAGGGNRRVLSGGLSGLGFMSRPFTLQVCVCVFIGILVSGTGTWHLNDLHIQLVPPLVTPYSPHSSHPPHSSQIRSPQTHSSHSPHSHLIPPSLSHFSDSNRGEEGGPPSVH